MQMMFDSIFQTIGKYFQPISILFYVLYATFVFGIAFFNIEYLMIFKTLIHSFVCLFLIIRFHPFREHNLTKYDSRIIFSAATILLLNTGIIDTIYGYIEQYKIENHVKNLIERTNELE